MVDCCAKRAFILFWFAVLTTSLQASNLVDARPLTDRIIVLHFDDGYIEHFGYHETSDQDRAVQLPLNVTRASDPLSYSVSSPDDPQYSAPARPLQIGRKSKGKDFSRKCHWNGSQCVNEIVFEHFIYLVLPSPLATGRSYSVNLGGLVESQADATVGFDESRVRSEAVHVNQIGYVPAAQVKYGYVSHWLGDLGGLVLDGYDGARFDLLKVDTGASVFTGTMKLRYRKTQQETGQEHDTPNRNFSNADTWECDFSAFSTPGEYVLAVQGIGCSYPFGIGEDVYRSAFHLTARGLYHARAGIALEKPYTAWTRPADHHPRNGTTIRYTTLRYMDQTTESGLHDDVYSHFLPGQLSGTYGWYHDAGDWDGYPSHSAVPKHLMTVFEIAPEKFSDGELNIPESDNGIPDILDEAAWLVQYYRRNIGPTGGIFGSRISGDLAAGDKDGVPSWEDEREWVAFAEEPAASYDFAGMAAQLAYCLRVVRSQSAQAGRPVRLRDRTVQARRNQLREEIDSLEQAARNAYDWAQGSLMAGDEAKIRDLRHYATAWLYKLTGQAGYETQFETDNKVRSADMSAFDSQRWGVWAYATTPDTTPGLNKTLKADLIQATRNFADTDNLLAAERRSFRQGGNYWMPILVGQSTTPWVMPSILAFHLTKELKYLNCVRATADYMLGGNPLNMVWVTGLGRRFPREILHLDSWYDEKEEMVPGIVPYGPYAFGADKAWTGPWDPSYARQRAVYPDVDKWPGHELYFENRYCPITNEFTVHQNIAPAAAVYGYLTAEVSGQPE